MISIFPHLIQIDLTYGRLREHVKKLAFLADASAKGGGRGRPLTAKKWKFFSQNKKDTWNVLKQKNMQKYIVNFLQGYPLKTFYNIFLKY